MQIASIEKSSSAAEKNAFPEKALELEARVDCHFVKREYHDALACQLRAIEIRSANGDWAGAGNGAQNAGLLRFLLADHAGAIRSYEEALESRRRAGDLRGQALTLGRMAEVFQQIGQHEKAVELLEGSIRLFSRVNATKNIGTALNNMAVSYRETGQADKAMRYYERALEIRRQVGDFEGLAATLYNLSVLHSDQSNDNEARQLLEQARDLREAMGDIPGMSQTVLRLGMLQEKQGDTLSAITCYEQALQLARQDGVQSKDDEATALLNLADAFSSQGAVDRALATLSEAEKLFVETGASTGVAMTYYGRGRTLAAAGRASEALAYFGEAKAHFTNLNDRPRLISVFIAVGTILSGCREHQAARDAFASALELQRQLSLHRDEVVTLQWISRECAALGDADGARNAARTAADKLSYTAGHLGFDGVAMSDAQDNGLQRGAMVEPDVETSFVSYSLH